MLESCLLEAGSGYEGVPDSAPTEPQDKVIAVAERLTRQAALSGERVASILDRVKDRQARAGYPSDYGVWIGPVRLREI